MKTKISSCCSPLLVLVILLILPAGGLIADNTPAALNAGDRIALIPFVKGKYDIQIDTPLDNILTCSLRELCFVETELEEDADEKLTRHVREKLKIRYSTQLIPEALISQNYVKLMPFGDEETLKSIALKIGESVGARYVLVGAVWRYKDRAVVKGEEEMPAAVAFAVYLLDGPKKQIIWKKSFIKSQKALSDDVSNISMFLKGGMKWLTADEIAKYGVDEVFKDFSLPPATY